MDGTLIIIVLLVLLYVVVFLPRQRQVARQRAMQSALAVGDEVVTIGGMHGTVTGVEDDAVRLELSPGVEVRFVREAVASRRAPDAPVDPGATSASSAEDDDSAPQDLGATVQEPAGSPVGDSPVGDSPVDDSPVDDEEGRP